MIISWISLHIFYRNLIQSMPKWWTRQWTKQSDSRTCQMQIQTMFLFPTHSIVGIFILNSGCFFPATNLFEKHHSTHCFDIFKRDTNKVLPPSCRGTSSRSPTWRVVALRAHWEGPGTARPGTSSPLGLSAWMWLPAPAAWPQSQSESAWEGQG